jgi:hypothetical protein
MPSSWEPHLVVRSIPRPGGAVKPAVPPAPRGARAARSRPSRPRRRRRLRASLDGAAGTRLPAALAVRGPQLRRMARSLIVARGVSNLRVFARFAEDASCVLHRTSDDRHPTGASGAHEFCPVIQVCSALPIDTAIIPGGNIRRVRTESIPQCHGSPVDGPVSSLPSRKVDHDAFILDCCPAARVAARRVRGRRGQPEPMGTRPGRPAGTARWRAARHATTGR